MNLKNSWGTCLNWRRYGGLMKEELLGWRKAIREFFKYSYIELMVFKYFCQWPWKKSRSMLMQYSSAMYSSFIRSWTHSSYNIKQAIRISFHYMISCCGQNSLAFGPLCATALNKPIYMWKGSKTQIHWLFWGRAGEYPGRAAEPYQWLSQGPLGK